MNRRAQPFRFACSLLVALLLSGCVSMRTSSRRLGDGETGGLDVRVYASDETRRADQPGPSYIAGELDFWDRSSRQWRPVFRSLDPVWAMTDLPEGKYRLRFPALLDEAGNAERIEAAERVFRIRPGAITEITTTLDHFPTGWVVAGVAAATIALVLLDWDNDGPFKRFPKPSGKRLLRHLENAPWLLDAAATIAFELTVAHQLRSGWIDRPPLVTSHFPAEGDLVATDRVRIVFALSEPIEDRYLNAEAITVLAENIGMIAGSVNYDDERWWLTWEAAEELPRDEVFHVTLGAESLKDLAGQELPIATSFSFRTAR